MSGCLVNTFYVYKRQPTKTSGNGQVLANDQYLLSYLICRKTLYLDEYLTLFDYTMH